MRRATVLVIDDDPQIRELEHETLTADGYEVFVARDGAEAFQLLTTIPRPSVILLDLHMPGMGGEAFLARLRSNPALSSIPVLVVTGDRAPRAPGANLVVAKPFQLKRFLEEVGRLAKKRGAQRYRRRLKLTLGDRPAFTADVSRDGFCAETMGALPAKQAVTGTVWLDEKPFAFKAQIVWTVPGVPTLQIRGRLGVRFTEVSPEFAARLEPDTLRPPPAAAGSAAVRSPQPPALLEPAPPAVRSQGRVLVVEDDGEIRQGLRELLEEEELIVATAGNGRDALEALRFSPRPDVILLDLMMPVMSGEDLLQSLQANPGWRTIPVIVMSVRSPPAGWRGPFVRKPFDLQQLVKAVRLSTGSP